MRALAQYLPKGLIGQFMLVLSAALIAANLVAVALLSFERLRLERAASEEREIERVVSLLPVVEAVDAARRVKIAMDASTRHSRVSLDDTPFVEDITNAPRSQVFTSELVEALPGRDVRGAIMVRRESDNRDGQQRTETVAISVRLADSGAGPAQWLNVVSRVGQSRGPKLDDEVFFLILGLSLAAVLGVSWLFLRRLTQPLLSLTDATRAAGAGDRNVRVNAEGSREVRDLAKEFNDMQARIACFDAERMRTLAAVGHDLRTPITSLRIRVELLDEDEAAPMIRTLDEMTVMAEGLVSFAKGAGDAEDVQTLDLTRLVSDLAEERGGTMIASEPVSVKGRPVGLKRAIGNLIDNAIRYGKTARISVREERQQAIVTVEDDGPGIPKERLDAMFEPFVRGEDSRNEETGGTGLGLAIARTIVIAHGGEIKLSNISGGLQATITLPIGSRRT